MPEDPNRSTPLNIGWAQADLTPDQPVLIAGQFHARLSEGVDDPITATAAAFEGESDYVIFVSCDLVTISEALRKAVRRRVADSSRELEPEKVVLNATHTHTGPEVRLPEEGSGHSSRGVGVELDAMPAGKYLDFASERIAGAVLTAWENRCPGSVAFGLGQAVVGRNRRWVNRSGAARMYGDTNTPEFSHIEGYEDHSVNLLAAYGEAGELTGLVVNVPCPSQVSEHRFSLSADYWHETRQELRRRLGEGLPVLAQCSAAGDQSPHLLFESRANQRMLDLAGRREREEIANRIAGAVEDTLTTIEGTAESYASLEHHLERLELPKTALSEEDVAWAEKEAEKLRATYEQQKSELAENPEKRQEKRWYRDITRSYRRMRWFKGVVERYESQDTEPTISTELHVIRMGPVAFATNRFEYYVDFGIHIKARSEALQTFVVQLAGPGTYVPTERSTAAGGYGSIPASNPVGPDGGWQLAWRTVEIIEKMWEE